MPISTEQINLFQSLFKGREDVYAKRWEKEGRSGYMPAYDVDWDRSEKHKALGCMFQNFKLTCIIHQEICLWARRSENGGGNVPEYVE